MAVCAGVRKARTFARATFSPHHWVNLTDLAGDWWFTDWLIDWLIDCSLAFNNAVDRAGHIRAKYSTDNTKQNKNNNSTFKIKQNFHTKGLLTLYFMSKCWHPISAGNQPATQCKLGSLLFFHGTLATWDVSKETNIMCTWSQEDKDHQQKDAAVAADDDDEN